MLFADVALARRIERAECRLITGLAESARHRSDGILIQPLAGGVAVFTGVGSPTNKLAGLGFGGPVDSNELEAIEREFDNRATPLQAEVSSLADNTVAEMLTRRGYALVGFENVLGMRLDKGAAAGPPARAESISVVASTDADLALWTDTVIDGFGHPDTVEGITPHESFEREILVKFMTLFAGAPGFRRYLTRVNGETSGGASMRTDDGVALLCGAATLPAYRRRGVQTALLRARLSDAAAAGCDIAVMTVGPGTKSQENGQKQGFSLLYTRAILRRDAR